MALNTHKLFFIADDDEDDIFFFREALEEVDRTVRLVTARDGDEAMNLLNTSNKEVPDFIFLDLNMPKKSGKECLTEIRQQSKLKDVPIIIYTTSSLHKDMTETLGLGANLFITKFIDFKELCQTLSSLLKGELWLTPALLTQS